MCTKRNTAGERLQRMHEGRGNAESPPECRLCSMPTSVRSLAEQQKFGRIFFFIITFSPFSSTPNNKNSAEFFCAFGSFNHSRYQCFISLYGSTRLNYPYPHRSRLSSLLANRLSAQPVLVYPPSFLRITRPLPSFQSSFHLVLLLRHSSTTVIVLRSWPSSSGEPKPLNSG